MTLRVVHSHQTQVPDNPVYDVSANIWNADHQLIGALTKADVGLDQVDNTSDVNKPVSSAQAAAIAAATPTPVTGSLGSWVQSISPALTGPITLTNATADVPGLVVTGNSDTLHSGGGVAAFRVNTTWNTGGAEWGRGLELNVTNTGSANNSYLLQCNVDGGSAFAVRYSGGAAEFSSSTGAISVISYSSRVLLGSNFGTRWTIETDGTFLAWNNGTAVNTGAVNVSALPNPHGAGARCAVNDSTVALSGATVGLTVVGGAGFTVPVFYDGANWIIGG